jgi:hypothetical protein
LPVESTASPEGKKKKAAAPRPSPKVQEGEPARRLVTPLGDRVADVWSRVLAGTSGVTRLPDDGGFADLPSRVGVCFCVLHYLSVAA